MFYNDSILAKKGPLANIWLAAHWDRRLSKSQIVQTNIEGSVKDMINGALPPMALRLSGQLLLGVSKIYGRKTKYLLEDCAEAFSRLKFTFTIENTNLPSNASKAAHNSITIPNVINLDDAIAPEPELDLEALLNETVSTSGNIMNNTTQFLKRPNLDYEVGRLDFGLEPTKEEDLPSEFQMDLDFDRRKTLPLEGQEIPNDESINDPSRLSIEVGRRLESSRQSSSLPFSPLRTPTKLSTAEFELESIPMNDHPEFFNEPPPHWSSLNNINPTVDLHSQLNSPKGGSPPILLSSPAKKTRLLHYSRSKKSVSLDRETELSDTLVQEHLKDTSPILLPKPSWLEHCLIESMDLLSSSFKSSLSATMNLNVTKKDSPHLQNNSINTLNDGIVDQGDFAATTTNHQIPLNDEEYLLGPEDYNNFSAPPKSPCLVMSLEADENAVPNFNAVKLGDGSPQKAPRPSTNSIVNASFCEETVEILVRCQNNFKSTDKPIPFSELVTPPARKNQAAEAFLQLLVLSAKGLVKPSQIAPYGGISVKPTPALFTALPEALSITL